MRKTAQTAKELEAEAGELEREAALIRVDASRNPTHDRYEHWIRTAEARELRATIIRCTLLLNK